MKTSLYQDKLICLNLQDSQISIISLFNLGVNKTTFRFIFFSKIFIRLQNICKYLLASFYVSDKLVQYM